MTENTTVEPQYDIVFRYKEEHGIARLGLMANVGWVEDPKRLLFTLSRYKFVAKMFEGKDAVLEIGCADAFATRVVKQHVNTLTAIDFDPAFIEDAKERSASNWPIKFDVHNIVGSPYPGSYNAAYMLDVLEHIDPADEHTVLGNVCKSLSDDGAFICGIPSLESQVYASPQSKAGHVNCKTAPDLKKVLQQHFHNVFIFSMNDEIVHTGYHKMAHYVIGLCSGKK